MDPGLGDGLDKIYQGHLTSQSPLHHPLPHPEMDVNQDPCPGSLPAKRRVWTFQHTPAGPVISPTASTAPPVQDKLQGGQSEKVFKMATGPVTAEMLANAQASSLRTISSRIRDNDKAATASPAALGVARQQREPRAHRKHRIEDTIWQNDIAYTGQKPQSGSIAGQDVPETNLAASSQQVTLQKEVGASPKSGLGQRNSSVDYNNPNVKSRVKVQPSTSKRNGHNKSSVRNESKKVEDPRWATKADLQPIKAELENLSNAWGSEIPSNASQGSGDSLQMLHSGKMIQKAPDHLEQGLTGWDGKMLPPPVDWQDRPKFNTNNRSELRNSVNRWQTEIKELVCSKAYPAPVAIEHVKNLAWHADGVSMVKRTFTITEDIAKTKYGYEETAADAAKYAQTITEEEFEDWGKLDPTKQANTDYQNETTDDLVNTWIANTANNRKLAQDQARNQEEAKAVMLEYKAAPAPERPVVNIYLRPALKIDAEQMLIIYNWYIEYSARPTEMRPVDIDDMMYRLEDSQSNKLPIIVAIMKNKASGCPIDRTAEIEAWEANPHPIRNIDPSASIITTHEKVVGWASASDFTASDFVEHIATDMELYVHPGFRQKGIGRCLMDKMLETLDIGYLKRGGYPFHCAQDIRHMYSSGGARDIHKIVLTFRKWKQPRDFNGRPIRNAAEQGTVGMKLNDREDDYDIWLKEWLESWGFQVEGLLSGVGAKNGRFLDTVFFGRETAWQPSDGRIPDPLPGTLGA